DETVSVQCCDVRAELSAEAAVFRGVALHRDEGPFFREYPMRCRARYTADRLVWIRPRLISAAVISSTVASDISSTIRRSSCSILPLMGEAQPPPLGIDATLPVFRYRDSVRLTVARPT